MSEQENKDSLLQPNQADKDSFRQTISTVDSEGKRKWIYPKKPKGKLHTMRSILSVFFLAFLFGAPFIEIGGDPLLLFNVPDRHFIIFSLNFWPQDFYIVVIAFITGIVFIVLFTVIYGRLFCGWVCPQTVFMEMVFRKIEYLIEGDYTKQKKLAKMPWNAEKTLKKGLKHAIFFAIAVIISNTFLAYIIGKDALFEIISEPVSKHLGGFTTLLIFSGVFYWIFAWFREQVCLIACPYGRLQGVLLDKKSIVVAYDYQRGEPRGKLRKKVERTEGDCIDCKQCVHVCPTGIDIRNGTQLECINCTACIDACNDIMDLVNKPRGLIRFDSEEHIAEKKPFRITTRTVAYSCVLLILLGVLTIFMVNRSDLQATVMRSRGQTYQTTELGNYRNLYKTTILNKSREAMDVTLKLEKVEGSIVIVDSNWQVPRQGMIEKVFFVDLPESSLEGLSTKIVIGVYDENGNRITTAKTRFLGPLK